jgi:hypothetical protein
MRRGPYACVHCGQKFEIDVDTDWDGESSYPVYTAVVVP